MKRELFEVYKERLLKWIESSITPEHLVVCHDVMDRFNEQFKYSIDAKLLSDAMDELSAAYLQKQAELG